MGVIERRRPGIPADYGVATDTTGMLEWNDVAAALAAAPIFWVATVNPSSTPHLIPIWGAWVESSAYIEGGDMTRWSRNLAVRPTVHIGVDHDATQIMVRGEGEQIEASHDLQTDIADCYAAKYPYRPAGTTYWEVRARRVLAWSTSDLESFGTTPTEFVFEETS